MIAFAVGLQLGVRPTRWAVLGPGLLVLSGIGPLWAGLAGPRPAHFLLTFLGAATGLILLSRPMARDPNWQRLAGYALTTGIAILVVIPLHSLLALPAEGPLHPWWGLFNWSAITLWLTCTVVLALRLLRVAGAAPQRSRETTTEPEGQAVQFMDASSPRNVGDGRSAWPTTRAKTRGWCGSMT